MVLIKINLLRLLRDDRPGDAGFRKSGNCPAISTQRTFNDGIIIEMDGLDNSFLLIRVLISVLAVESNSKV